MAECFVSFIVDGKFYCRCSVGDLLEGEEVDEFKKQSDILEPGGLFVFHEGVSLDSVAERYEHRTLLDKFKSENSIDAKNSVVAVVKSGYETVYPDPPPWIQKMREFIRIAEVIRKDRPNDTIEETAPTESQCYIYVIDIQRKFIAFALPCPDEKTGTRACMTAVNETGFDGNDRFSFQSGVISVDSHVTIQIEPDSWFGAIAAQDKQVTGRGGRIIVREGKKTHLQFDRDAFEFAASHTNEFLTGGSCAESHKEILAFMRSVDKALKKLIGVVVHSTAPAPTALLQNLPVNFKQHMDSVNRFVNTIQNKPVGFPLVHPTLATLSETEPTTTALTDTTETVSANDANAIPEPVEKTPSNTTQQGEGKTANDRLRDFLESHPECKSWTNEELGRQIGVSGATVRKTAIWQELSKRREVIKNENKIRMQLNNEHLSHGERKKRENKLRDD